MSAQPTAMSEDPKHGATGTGRRIPEIYTDAPTLHGNPLIATLQIAIWLFFRPSAWRKYIERAEPTLAPDFSLAQLTRAQIRNPAIRRLLFLGHILAPLLTSTLLAVELLLLRVPLRFLIIRVLACFAMSAGGSIIFGTGSAEAVGIASGIMGGLIGSVVFALAVVRTGHVVFTTEASVSAMVQDFMSGGPAGLTALMVAFGVAAAGMFVAVGSVGAGVSARRAQLRRRPNAGGLLLGLLFGAFFFAAATASAALLPFKGAVAFGGFLAGLISARWMTRMWLRSIVFGLACALNNHLLVNVLAPMTHDIAVVGIMMGIILGAWFALPYMLAEEVAGSWSGALAGSLGFCGGWLLTLSAASREHMSLGTHFLPGLISLELAVFLGLTDMFWRPFLLFPFEEAWNLILLRADQRHPPAPGQLSWLRFHSAFWDEHQRFRLYGLDEHLVLVFERSAEEGTLAIERVAMSHQRWASTAAQIEIAARRMERCAAVEDIARIHHAIGTGDLGGPASALLSRFSGFSQDIEAALSQSSAHNQRLGLGTVQQRLEVLIGEVDRSSDPYASRFRPVAAHWRKLIAEHMEQLHKAVELRQEIDNPYVIGVPLTLAQEIFVGRTDISARIEQFLLDRRRPPLLLYGQRRMGKTSLLNNLGRLLPTTIVPLFVDLQGPASSARDHAGLLYNLARGMIDSARKQRGLILPALSREVLAADPFTAFDEWLDGVEAALERRTALLALDEFEALDAALRAGRFDEGSVLGMLRHLVQHRQKIKTLIAGSHTLDELSIWSSYLVNVQVIQVGYLGEEDARRLIEHPVPDMTLRYAPEASERVLRLTRGHPFLVQLLCSEIIALKNEQDPAVRRLATVADVMTAVPEALLHGSFFFADVERNQIDAAGQTVLRLIAARGEGVGATRDSLLGQAPALDLDAALQKLQHRELIEPCDGGYRFQVELIRRWFTTDQSSLR